VSDAWLTVIAVGAGTIVLKAIGPVLVSGRQLHPRLNDLLELVAPAILAALVVTEAFGSGRSLVLDARVAGLIVGIVGVRLRAPFWAIILVGGLATALVRLA
jgi:uncharacterized membrane protein